MEKPPLRLLYLLAFAVVVAGAFSLRSRPAEIQTLPFERQWQEALVSLALATPMKVKTERFVMELPEYKPEPLQEEEPPIPVYDEAPKPKTSPKHDICRGKGRTYYTKRGGYQYWRCKR
jgi:hypothetical protein